MSKTALRLLPTTITKLHMNHVGVLLLLFIEMLVVVWTSYDRSIPCWDTATHKLNALTIFDLLTHAHPRQLNWYRSIFAVSQLYPPFFYIISAFLKFIFGQLADTELITNMIFIAILFFSLHYITKTTWKNALASWIAPGLIFLYPAVFWSTHCALLDFAATAMTGFGLACFIWWSENPETRKSIILGLILGLVFLTKNNTPIFFVGPSLVEIFSFWQEQRQKLNYVRIRQLLVVALISFIFLLPWLILAGPVVIKFILSIQQQNFQNTIQSVSASALGFDMHTPRTEFFSQLHRFTFMDLPLIVSPVLFYCFLGSLLKIGPFNRNKLYLITSIIFAIIVASAFRWPHQFRYIVPVSVSIATITAGFFAQLRQSKQILGRFLLFGVTLIVLIQFVYEAFSPFPLTFPTWIDKFMHMSGAEFGKTSMAPAVPGIAVNPMQDSGEAIIWSLNTIEDASGGKPTSLMIMPNANPINCSPYSYLTKTRKDYIEVASPREHTELGEKVAFLPHRAIWYKWYILKSGDQGNHLSDKTSVNAYNNWLNFISQSGFYKLVNTKPLSDGSILQLYCRKDTF